MPTTAKTLADALSGVINSETGRQTLHKLAEGQGTATPEGKAWLRAKAVLDDYKTATAASGSTNIELGQELQDRLAQCGDGESLETAIKARIHELLETERQSIADAVKTYSEPDGGMISDGTVVSIIYDRGIRNPYA